MDMRMVLQPLAPCVQHGEEAEPGAQPFGIGPHLQQRLRHGAKQNAVDHALVLQGQRPKFAWKRENHVRVGNRQNVFGAGRKPLVPFPRVAFGTVAVAARLVFDHLMRAVVALLYELAECGGAARTDVPEGFPLLVAQRVPPAVEEGPPVLSEDIGDFQPMLLQRCRWSFDFATG